METRSNAIFVEGCFLKGFRWNSDGYLVLVLDSDTVASEPLLLDTTRHLLARLRPPSSRADHHLYRASSPTNITATKVKGNKEVKKGKKGDKEGNGKEDSRKSTTPEEFQYLLQVHHLGELLLKGLLDIEKMKEEKIEKVQRDRSISNYKRQNDDKVRALEKQQQARLMKEAHICATELDGGNDSSEGPTTKDESSNSDYYEYLRSALRMARTLNSIRALFPVIAKILNHKQARDKLLTIHSKTIDSGKKEKCFLIGTHVFDVCKTSQVLHLQKGMEMMLISLLPKEFCHDTSSTNMVPESIMLGNDVEWKTFLPMCFRKYHSQDNGSNITTTNTMHVSNPLQLLLTQSKKISISMTNALKNAYAYDEQFLPILQNRQYHSDYQKSIEQLVAKLTKIIRCGMYRDASLHIYGSCLSDLALGTSSDVDLSLHLPEALQLKKIFDQGDMEASDYNRKTTNLVHSFAHKLRGHTATESGIGNIDAVARARIPVIKGIDYQAKNPYNSQHSGSISFDICFLNDIAVVNSSLLKEYSLVTPQGKLLMLIVKAWARDSKLNSAADSTLSSYAWMNLVIFYLQCLGMVPNLQCSNLMNQIGFFPDRNNPFHFCNGLSTAFLTWNQVRTSGHWTLPSDFQNVSVTALFYGFLNFYTFGFPLITDAVSIRFGKDRRLLKTQHENCRLSRLCIEDPFETFDSYFPHDLGSPCGEKGFEKISNAMKATEEKLQHLLLSDHETKKGNTKKHPIAAFWPAGRGLLSKPQHLNHPQQQYHQKQQHYQQEQHQQQRGKHNSRAKAMQRHPSKQLPQRNDDDRVSRRVFENNKHHHPPKRTQLLKLQSNGKKADAHNKNKIAYSKKERNRNGEILELEEMKKKGARTSQEQKRILGI